MYARRSCRGASKISRRRVHGDADKEVWLVIGLQPRVYHRARVMRDVGMLMQALTHTHIHAHTSEREALQTHCRERM